MPPPPSTLQRAAPCSAGIQLCSWPPHTQKLTVNHLAEKGSKPHPQNRKHLTSKYYFHFTTPEDGSGGVGGGPENEPADCPQRQKCY